MNLDDRQAHWQNIYLTKAENEVSWFQEAPSISLELIQAAGVSEASSIIDIGGGASRLVDKLVDLGHRNVTVLDLSEAALAMSRARMGDKALLVDWIVADVTIWEPTAKFDLWHDRAAFHFLTEDHHRAAYVARMKQALRPGGPRSLLPFHCWVRRSAAVFRCDAMIPRVSAKCSGPPSGWWKHGITSIGRHGARSRIFNSADSRSTNRLRGRIVRARCRS